MFSDYPNAQTRSAGLNNDAEVQLGVEDVLWADIIFVMEQAHKKKLRNGFKKHLIDQRVICLGIPDNYGYMDDELIAIFKRIVPQYLG